VETDPKEKAVQQINNTWISSDGLAIIMNGLPGASPAPALSDLPSASNMKILDFRLILKFVNICASYYL
jgi:hypothetical protein